MPTPSLAEVLDALQEIAPLELAAEWDNVGLLIDPPRGGRGGGGGRGGRGGRGGGACRRVLLAIDFGEAVLQEALRLRADLAVAYHPPLFPEARDRGVRRLSRDVPLQRAVMGAVAAGLPIYSPHTALDAAPGGVADWLAEVVLGGAEPAVLRPCGDGDFGRFVEWKRPVPLRAVLQRLKRRLGVRTLRVAAPPRPVRAVRTAAVAAGSGGGVLRGERADLWLTGELSHHDALAAAAAGTTVVLAGHSDSERGYLRVLRKRLLQAFGRDLDVRLAASDRDPFTTV